MIADRNLLMNSRVQVFDNIIPVTIRHHDIESGCTIAHYFGIQMVLPIAPHLRKTGTHKISVCSNDIALSKRYIKEISIQNQLKGRICAIIRTPEHAIVQVDCGTTLLAGISLRALAEMDLQEGDSVYCLIKASSFSYVSDKTSVMGVRRFNALEISDVTEVSEVPPTREFPIRH